MARAIGNANSAADIQPGCRQMHEIMRGDGDVIVRCGSFDNRPT
jgi:hypothetical protein